MIGSHRGRLQINPIEDNNAQSSNLQSYSNLNGLAEQNAFANYAETNNEQKTDLN